MKEGEERKMKDGRKEDEGRKEGRKERYISRKMKVKEDDERMEER